MTFHPLVLCSKSAWEPSLRREHAFANLASANGYPVVFLERPLDVRALTSRRSRGEWLRAATRRTVRSTAAGVAVVHTATLVPGHRNDLAQWLDTARLANDLRRLEKIDTATVVATQPWQWPAVSRVASRRRVFDCADDWRVLVASRDVVIKQLERRIADEADAIICVNSDLADRFGAKVHVIPNGPADELLRTRPVPAEPGSRRMVYVGTLSERFDVAFMREVITRLPAWTVDLYGQCQYAGYGAAPSPEFGSLLSKFAGRVRWHGAVDRGGSSNPIDSANVAIIPHRLRYTHGQDSMKLYDYAARARPIVSNVPFAQGTYPLPEAIVVADSPGGFAAAVECAAQTNMSVLSELRKWAEGQSWQSRWPHWSAAAFGDAESEADRAECDEPHRRRKQ